MWGSQCVAHNVGLTLPKPYIRTLLLSHYQHYITLTYTYSILNPHHLQYSLVLPSTSLHTSILFYKPYYYPMYPIIPSLSHLFTVGELNRTSTTHTWCYTRRLEVISICRFAILCSFFHLVLLVSSLPAGFISSCCFHLFLLVSSLPAAFISSYCFHLVLLLSTLPADFINSHQP